MSDEQHTNAPAPGRTRRRKMAELVRKVLFEGPNGERAVEYRPVRPYNRPVTRRAAVREQGEARVATLKALRPAVMRTVSAAQRPAEAVRVPLRGHQGAPATKPLLRDRWRNPPDSWARPRTLAGEADDTSPVSVTEEERAREREEARELDEMTEVILVSPAFEGSGLTEEDLRTQDRRVIKAWAETARASIEAVTAARAAGVGCLVAPDGYAIAAARGAR